VGTSKPYVGYRSPKRKESNNDREGAKGAPLAAIRGWIAGTAGLPGDLEGLVRMLPGIERKEPVLPTSDFYKEWLPLRGESPVERAFTEAGSLTGGAGVGSGARAVRAGGEGAMNAVKIAARNAAVPRTLSPQAGVIKMKGGNWLDGSVEDALKGLKVDRFPGQTSDLAAKAGLPLEDYLALPPAERKALNESMYPGIPSMNNWIDKKLARYVKNEMATPEDPIRALAEKGVLHVDPEVGGMRIQADRAAAGYPAKGFAKTPLAVRWEDNADQVVGSGKASFHASSPLQVRNNPWLAKVPPETSVYDLNMRGSSLGFDHLIDELRNATNPESGLPRELLLKYDALDRVTVPQAVERVSKINEWRAAQKAEANAALANNAATVLHKEYPEGYRWVELSAGERPTGPAGYEYLERKKSLADALKYEGDTMGHCVGGYCDDVASGKSRIYSLRDKKGQPHTTIEIAPSDWYDHMKNRSMDDSKLFNAQFKTRLAEAGINPKGQGPEATELGNSVYKELFGSAPEPMIKQIKGKGNKAPNPEYLPYVQDFVRSGKWSDVGDLSNTGLIGIDRESDMAAAFSKLGKEPPRYVTQDELTNLLKWNRGESPLPEGFSQGGAVNAHDYDPNRVDALVQALEAGFGQ